MVGNSIPKQAESSQKMGAGYKGGPRMQKQKVIEGFLAGECLHTDKTVIWLRDVDNLYNPFQGKKIRITMEEIE